MKATYEHVDFGASCSVRVYNRRLPRIPFERHHHPEYELTLTMNSQGKRYIGDSVAVYGDDDLVLVPPDLPHTWSSNRSIDPLQPQVAIVVWFDGGWVQRLADLCPEYADLRNLLRRAACGLSFQQGAGTQMRAQLDRLLSANARERLTAVLDILILLSDLPGEALTSPSAFDARAGTTSAYGPDRLNRVLSLIDTQFTHPLKLGTLAKAAGMSERTLTRHFTQHLGESVGAYIARVRIGHACRMLADTALPISVVASRSGFPNLANFNRQFKMTKQMTPIVYRKQFSGTKNDASPSLTERSPSLDSKQRVSKRRSRAPT
ncbi:helix-turn-helix domain-containing protein [Paraburkholderia caribensis]|uniref:helix-turn-helix domain-containing protein n=1 Tax=Paraburkholderia caribensis TaxID=75105 RepID=UPI001CAFB12F|nr:AraC family transcriptional regulator [Paraburkholderia caribensis]CAG9248243.1 AraC family transcriptional regulator [Paraburkholderia caribensis]